MVERERPARYAARMQNPSFGLCGVIHLPPLPGAPRGGRSREEVLDAALRDAEALVAGGIRRVIIENLGDAPFLAGAVPPHVPALLAVVADRLGARFGGDLALGINVLRNDGAAAVGAAVASGADFVRVNVLVGAAWTDQGLIEGQAHALLQYRRSLGAPVAIFADVLVKHAVPAGAADLEEVARETVERGGADALVVTGRKTGGATDLDHVRRVRAALPGVPVWVGSGVTRASARAVAAVASGAIVGTELHADGDLRRPVDRERVRALVEAVAG